MTSFFLKKLILIFCVLITVTPVIAMDLTVSIAKMPVISESPEKGILIDFVKAMAKAEGINIKIKVEPFARSLDSLKKGKVDFQLPFSEMPPEKAKEMSIAFSTETIFHVNFILYSNIGQKVTLGNLSKLKIETDRAHLNYFDFPVIGSSCIPCSLKKVDKGRIDGYIFADAPSDPVVKSLKLSKIRRQLFKVFNVKMTISPGKRGKEVDKILSSAIAKIRANGMLAKTVGKLEHPYNNWQPSQL